jgi:four helix bundle protein
VNELSSADPKAGSRKQEAGSRKQEAGNRKQGWCGPSAFANGPYYCVKMTGNALAGCWEQIDGRYVGRMTITDDSSDFRPKKIRSYRDLIVWRKGISLAVESYELARKLPASERFILRDQMLRAAVSIPSNIAEGHGQVSKGVFVRHLGIARGSLNELETLLEIAKRVDYHDDAEQAKATLLADEVGRMLWVLMQKLGTRHWK